MVAKMDGADGLSQRIVFMPPVREADGKKPRTRSASSSKSHRNDIQMMRGIAIVFVLLFHMWPKRVAYGFLGVDTFFVISGYLMCMLLAPKLPLSSASIVDFYFRRLKRIVPLYLTVVLLVLLAVRQLVSPIEFKQLVEETIPALGFFSNMPGTREVAYFDISSRLYFFLHSWSLSVELQFYAVVPLLFVAFDRIAAFRPLLKFALLLALPLGSLVFQSMATGDRAHMLLVARIWQFFAGFAAYCARECRLFDFDEMRSDSLAPNGVEAPKQTTGTGCLTEVTNAVLHFGLVFLLIFGIPELPQLCRLLVVLLSAVIVGRHNEQSIFSRCRPLVLLGDASYSIYLVHWPLFVWHRYANSDVYVDGGEPDFQTGFTLVFASCLLGFLLEEAFKRMLRFVDGWAMLLVAIFFLYYLNGGLLYEINEHAVNLDAGVAPDQRPEDWQRKVREDVEMLWRSREHRAHFEPAQITAFNAELIHAYSSFAFCDNQDRAMPTRFPLNMSAYRQDVVYTCHAKGNGTKNIVVIGNSHSMHQFPGIWSMFRSTYKRLTLFMRNSCLPTSRKFQQPGRSEQDLNECMDLLNATAPALREWKYPIDVVIALYALVDLPDIPLPANISEDGFFTAMHEFYAQLATIPREALIIQQSNPIFSQVPIHEVESRMKSGRPLDTIGDKRETLLKRLPTMRKRMEMLQLPRTIKLDFIAAWCNRTAGDFCHSTSPQGIIDFADQHHPSALGSFYSADYMRQKYYEFIR
ncbi:hypothetical protein M3Y99_01784700 [Aphelenchoides fujianensis]|nr:hypothetical protein M3Y99_01784700 [Aphelenchoides fujianensis]